MGTSFQELVWEKLNEIPVGTVTTYAFIARSLGNPHAVRAVGTAVGKNPDAPTVPCHRVVKSDGSIGQYSGRGGVSGKIALLKKEGVKAKAGKVEKFEKILFSF